jgi:hypothetical protein
VREKKNVKVAQVHEYADISCNNPEMQIPKEEHKW